ncbi:MAG: amidohydrolase family protein [Lentisphaeria bacterium]
MQQTTTQLLISNAQIYDGSGNAPFAGEVVIQGDKILAIAGKGGLSRTGCEVFDAGGAVLCPGFIDVHSHSDVPILKVPSADSKVSQGMTTEIVGNCGFSEFVYSKEKNALGDLPFQECDGSFNTYAEKVEQARPAVNIAALCGHNSLRVKVMGYAERPATPAEIAQMKELLAQALEQGAAGFSSGLWYVPGRFSESAEIKQLASLLRNTGKPYCTHMRNEGNLLFEAIAEAIEIAQCGSGSLQISHFKTWGKHNWGKIDRAIELVEEALHQGVKILADRYPYTYSNTSLRMVVPSPYNKIDNDRLTEMLKNSVVEREKLLALLECDSSDRAQWDKILVISSETPEHERFLGLNMLQIAEQLQLSPAAACVKLLSESLPSAAFGIMCEENLQKFLSQSWMIPGSDGSIHEFSDTRTHPRAFGTFPRFFQIARAHAPLAEVIHRMTALPAEKFQLSGRGRIAPGYFADLLLFEPEKYYSSADYVVPNRICEGVFRVYVNGALAYAPDTSLKRQQRGRMLRIRSNNN